MTPEMPLTITKNGTDLSIKETARTTWVVLVMAVLLPLTAIAGFMAYYQIFSVFAPYDDDGYLMMTIRQYLAGHALYDELYTQYGPFYYVFESFIHGTAGVAISHDATRLISIVIWVAIAVISSIFIYRVTRSLTLAAAVHLLVFVCLDRIVLEPGHPQEICGLIFALCLLISTFDPSRRSFEIGLCALGIILGALCLTKINVGTYLVLAVCLALLVFSGKKGPYRALSLIFMCGALLLPSLLIGKFLVTAWGLFSLLITVSMGLIFLFSFYRSQPADISLRHYLLVFVPFGLTVSLICGWMLIRGTSVAGLVHGIVLQHMKFAALFFMPTPVYRYVAVWILGAVAVAFIFARQNRSKMIDPARFALLANALKLAFGLTVLFSAYLDVYRHFLLMNFASPYLWLVLYPEGDEPPTFRWSFPRVVLCMVIIMETLKVYPMTGSHMAFATFTMILVGAICIHDALRGLSERMPRLRFDGAAARYAALFLVMGVVSGLYLLKANHAYRNYQSLTPLNFAGASRLRLPEDEAAVYISLVRNLNTNSDTFVSMPGLNSLYFWAQKDPPTEVLNTTAWFSLLTPEQQRIIVDKFSNYPLACALYHPQLTKNCLRGQELGSFPLVAYIQENFKVVGRIGEYDFLARKEREPLELIYYAEYTDTPSAPAAQSSSTSEPSPAAQGLAFIPTQRPTVMLRLPNEQWKINRIVIYNISEKTVIADSGADAARGGLIVMDEHARSMALPVMLEKDGANMNSKSRLLLLLSSPIRQGDQNKLVVRLLDSEGNPFASVPLAFKE